MTIIGDSAIAIKQAQKLAQAGQIFNGADKVQLNQFFSYLDNLLQAKISTSNEFELDELKISSEVNELKRAIFSVFPKEAVDQYNELNNELVCAVSNNSPSEVKSLLEQGANINVNEHSNFHPLIISADRGYKNMTELLIQNGANIEAKDIIGWTPLMKAISKGNRDITKLLIEHWANVDDKDCTDFTDETPLMIAAQEGYEDIVEL